jgi:uncharacterized membrane protein
MHDLYFTLAARIKMVQLETASRGFFVLLFVGVGFAHFLESQRVFMGSLVPHLYPGDPVTWVYISGVVEIAGGLGLLTSHYRKVAGFLLLLLAALTQANIKMWTERRKRRKTIHKHLSASTSPPLRFLAVPCNTLTSCCTVSAIISYTMRCSAWTGWEGAL